MCSSALLPSRFPPSKAPLSIGRSWVQFLLMPEWKYSFFSESFNFSDLRKNANAAGTLGSVNWHGENFYSTWVGWVRIWGTGFEKFHLDSFSGMTFHRSLNEHSCVWRFDRVVDPRILVADHTHPCYRTDTSGGPDATFLPHIIGIRYRAVLRPGNVHAGLNDFQALWYSR